MITNLLGNAIKFSPANTEIKIEVTNLEHSIRFSVEDNGIGIPKEKLINIFDAFSQVEDTTTRRYGGTGLGLAISKNLIELMGGNLLVESTINKGSKFTFSLPLKDLPKKQVKIEYNESFKCSNSNCSILIVEDNIVNQKLMASYLTKLGAGFKFANNGQEAVDIFKKEKFDLIFMDENMPIMSGSIATKHIREFEKTNNTHTPIVCLTANAMIGDKARFLAAGMDEYLTKPVSRKKIQETLIRFLSKANLDQAS